MIIIAKEFKSKNEVLNQINASTSNTFTLYNNIRGTAVDEVAKLIKQKGRSCDIIIFYS